MDNGKHLNDIARTIEMFSKPVVPIVRSSRQISREKALSECKSEETQRLISAFWK